MKQMNKCFSSFALRESLRSLDTEFLCSSFIVDYFKFFFESSALGGMLSGNVCRMNECVIEYIFSPTCVGRILCAKRCVEHGLQDQKCF